MNGTITNRGHIAAREGNAAPLAFAVAAYVSGAALLASDTYWALAWFYAMQAAHVLPAPLLICLSVVAVIRSPRAPGAFLLKLTRDRGPHALTVIIAFCLGMAAFTTYKSQIPSFHHFGADAWLAELDRTLHFGDPWQLAHRLLPDWADAALGQLYGGAWVLIWFGTMLFVAIWPNDTARRRYLWAFCITMALLGTLAALALASGGPIFFDRIHGGERFAELIGRLQSSEAGIGALATADYLHTSYAVGAVGVGTGISAMPSMHVAIASLNAMLYAGINRWLGVVGWAYVAVILFGSVYLGWHYAIDGYLSLFVVAVIWFTTGRLFGEAGRKQH